MLKKSATQVCTFPNVYWGKQPGEEVIFRKTFWQNLTNWRCAEQVDPRFFRGYCHGFRCAKTNRSPRFAVCDLVRDFCPYFGIVLPSVIDHYHKEHIRQAESSPSSRLILFCQDNGGSLGFLAVADFMVSSCWRSSSNVTPCTQVNSFPVSGSTFSYSFACSKRSGWFSASPIHSSRRWKKQK